MYAISFPLANIPCFKIKIYEKETRYKKLLKDYKDSIKYLTIRIDKMNTSAPKLVYYFIQKIHKKKLKQKKDVFF